MKPLQPVLRTSDNWGLLILRLGVALAIFPHGAQKVLGWWGGMGFSKTLEVFAEKMEIPSGLTVLAMAAEFLGPMGLALGLLTRLSALGIAITMGVAVSMHASSGFFAGNGGFEYPLTLCIAALALVVSGGGKWSADRALAKAA
mgnify:CR=1 FL=1